MTMTDLARLTMALADRYAIERELGSGGMATVYLAEDLKHHRKVAIKVLRPELAAVVAADRFLREIEIAAPLTHAHILPLYDSGDADGFLYYVMPYIAGGSLRAKLAREGQLPIPEAVRILRDIVDALASAHKHGVVHRDIKPDNVLLAENHAYVTDFGVAKAVSEATGRQQLTTAGVALGTPTYMAPEQGAADPHVDHRADIYAVGVVAYEMLAGRPPFTGTTAREILAAHMADSPKPVTTHREAVTPPLAELVMKCLEKKPADRWQSAEEMLTRLESLTTPTGGVTSTATAPVASVPRRRVNVAVLTGVTVAIAILGFLGWMSLSRGGPSVTFSNIRQITRAPEIEYEPAISPDGREVAYTAGFGRNMHIYVRDLGGGRAFPLTADRPGTQINPRWTPDGRSIAFVEFRGTPVFPTVGSVAESRLIPRLGGPTRTIATGSLWGIHGDRVLYQRGDSVFLGSLGGGAPAFVASVPQSHSFAWSPDGQRIAYVQGNLDFIQAGTLGNVAPSWIWIMRVDGSDPVQVTRHPSLNVSPVWLPDGRHLLFISNRDGPRDIYVIQVDGSGRPRGEPVRLTTGLDPHSLSLSADGSTLAYSQFTLRRNVWEIAIPKTGSVSISEATPLTVGNQIVESLGVSRDGRWLAFDSNLEGNQDIYIMPVEGGEPRRITRDPGDDFSPDFCGDGREIAFHSIRYGTRDVFLVSVDGGYEVRLTDDPGEEYHPVCSPDGLSIAFFSYSPATRRGEVYVMSRDSMGAPWSTPRQLTTDGGLFPQWSPDGGRIVYQLAYYGGMGEPGIGLVTLGGETRRLLHARAAGFMYVGIPHWSRDGRLIYFVGTDSAGSRAVYAMPAAGGPFRELVRLDDPAKGSYLDFAVGDGKFYFSISERDSDIYVMDLAQRRGVRSKE